MISMPWKVDGPEYDIHDGYLLKMPGVIDTNLRIIDRYSKKFRLIKQIVRNPRELTVYENVPAVKPKVETKEPISNMPITTETSIPNVSRENDSDTEGKQIPGFGLNNV